MSSNVASIRDASKLIPTDQKADFLGVLCSAGCALHCAATPVLMSVMPSISSMKLLAAPLFHQTVAVICAVIVARAILPKWRQHRSCSVLLLATMGLGIVFLDAFWMSENCCEFHIDSSLALSSASADWLGQSSATMHQKAPLLLTRLQPFLSPLGGVLLILAHILNIRLNCCLGSTICRPPAKPVP